MDAQIESKLRANLSVQQLIIKDTSGGCGQSYELVLVAEQFESMGLLARFSPGTDLTVASLNLAYVTFT